MVGTIVLLLLQALYFLLGAPQFLFALLESALPRGRLPYVNLLFLLRLLVHQPYLLLAELQVRRQCLGAAKRVAAGVGANLGAVLGDPLECDQTFRAEQAQHLRKQVIERLFMARAEIGQAVMIHWLQAAQPREAWLVLTLARYFARTAHALAVGI